MENKDLIMALESLEREKNISRADTIKTIEDALISALRKHFGRTALLTAKIDPEVGTIEAYQTLVVAEEVTNPEVEISLEDAKKMVDEGVTLDSLSMMMAFARLARVYRKLLLKAAVGVQHISRHVEHQRFRAQLELQRQHHEPLEHGSLVHEAFAAAVVETLRHGQRI